MQDPESCQISRELALPRVFVNPRDKEVVIVLDLKNVMAFTPTIGGGYFFGYETDHRVVTVDIGGNSQNSWLAVCSQQILAQASETRIDTQVQTDPDDDVNKA